MRGRLCCVRGEDAGPEVQAVNVLPVVDILVRFFDLVLDGGAEVDGELADADAETGVVCAVSPVPVTFGTVTVATTFPPRMP